MRKSVDDKVLYSLIGKKIVDARMRATGGSLSQAQLAKKAGLTRGSIANIELGAQRAPVHTLWAIAEALGIEPRQLLPTESELEGQDYPEQLHFASSVRRVMEGMESGPRVQTWISQKQGELRQKSSQDNKRRNQ